METQQDLFINNYSIGDNVIVNLPRGPQSGKIFAIYKNYAWTDEVKYEVRGHELTTITSVRNIKPG